MRIDTPNEVELLPERRHPPPSAAGPALARPNKWVERTGEVAGLPTHWREAPGDGRRLSSTSTACRRRPGSGSHSWSESAGSLPIYPASASRPNPTTSTIRSRAISRWLGGVHRLGRPRPVHARRQRLGRRSRPRSGAAHPGPNRAARHPYLGSAPSRLPLALGRARVWRTPGLGELFMATSSKWAFRQLSASLERQAGSPARSSFTDRIWRNFDRGTRRAILRLYRASPSEVLAGSGEHLGALSCLHAHPLADRGSLSGARMGAAPRRGHRRERHSRDDRARGTLALARPPGRDREDSRFPRGLTAVVSPVSPI